jgi:hypothetical protein
MLVNMPGLMTFNTEVTKGTKGTKDTKATEDEEDRWPWSGPLKQLVVFGASDRSEPDGIARLEQERLQPGGIE